MVSFNVSPPTAAQRSRRAIIEEQYEYGDEEYGQEGAELHHDEEEEEEKTTGILGFFKKTFSSVKKTFESTFNQPREYHPRASTRPRSKTGGRRTPIADGEYDLFKGEPLLDESPRLDQDRRVRFAASNNLPPSSSNANVINRATRS